jgi:hypothetical protein
MQSIYVKTYFPKQRSVALTVAVGMVLTLVYLLSNSTQASGATVSASGGSCTQTVGSAGSTTVTVVNGKCVITFASAGSNTWTVPTGVSSVRTLVVGGGGGAGGGGCNWMYGRGGGGGDVVDSGSTSVAVTAGTTLSIRVGAGGAAAISRTVGGVINSCADGLPYSVGSTGGQGGSSQFGTSSAVIGGYSSPAGTSAGGASGNGNIGSGSAGAGNTLNSWTGGGGGGAGGPGTHSGSGSNWACGGGLIASGGPGKFSDISTGSLIGHGGGAGAGACAGNGSATSGGEFYSGGYSGTNYNGSYGGGALNATGGAGVVIISYIPVAARLIGNGGTIKTYSNVTSLSPSICAGGMRGMATDGTYVYFRTLNSASNICIASLSSGSFVRAQAVTPGVSAGSLNNIPRDQMALTYSSGCLFIRNSISASSTVNCIDTTTWVMSSPITPSVAIPQGGYWLEGNLMDFPDGRVGAVAAPTSTASSGGAASGANVCPTGSYCKILRTYTVTRSGGTASLTHSEDFTLADTQAGWPNDDHGMATDGTYLYQMMYNNGYKVWALNSGTPSLIVFNGAGTGTCTAPTGISGSMCNINKPISETSADNFGVNGVENATYLSRSHSTNQYIMGVVSANKFWVSDAVAPPSGPGSAISAGAPTIGVATATGGTTATVAFTAPASDGGATITSYTATSSPAGGTGTLSQAGSGTISVTGLTIGVAYTFTVTATNSVGTSVASAASNSVTNSYVSTITVPETTYVSASATTNITGLSVGGLAAGSTYQVALSLSPIPTGASLKLPTTTGLSASYGFTAGSNTFNSFTVITFSGLLANVNTALAALQYVSGATTGSPIVQVVVSSLDTSYALNGYNGHFYLSNTTLGLANATYTNARATAKLQSYRGLTGYLTTITSAGENSFISNNIANASNIIFGATDELVEGVWKWDTSGGSPEAGTQFWQGAANGYAVGSSYSAWSSGYEPNDSGGEDYPVTNWGGNLGVWNDCSNTICGAGTAKYVIEFGTSATDGGFVNSSSNLASSSFSLFYATSGQLPTVLTVDPQSSSRYLPTTLNTVGPTNLLLCLNESDVSGNNLASPTINFDVAANGAPATTAGTGTSTIVGDRTTATYIYGVTANVISTLNSVLGTQIYLSSGAFSATKYIKIRAISIASSSDIGSKTCASTVYTSQNIEIRPLVLERTMKKGTITLKQ